MYPLFNITPVKASGSYIIDDNGTEYLDLYGGHAVISVGHSHPHYVQRVSEQISRIGFYSNSVQMPLQKVLADKLAAVCGYEDYNLFLCNSGAEANENAFKLASFHTGRKKVVAFKGSFHGRTSLAVAATDDPSILAPANETTNVVFCAWNDLAELDAQLSKGDVAAVIIEGIQGVGGVIIPSSNFLNAISLLCKLYGTLLILDEVQSGCGRTGKFFAHQHSELKADIITMAKGMGNGFPVAGVLVSPEIKSRYGLLGTTFGGAYLACAAAIAVLEIMENEELMKNASEMGLYLLEGLKDIPGIKEIRASGLMVGIEFQIPCSPIRNTLLAEHKIFTGSSSNKNTLRILPALNVKTEELDRFIQALRSVMVKLALTEAA